MTRFNGEYFEQAATKPIFQRYGRACTAADCCCKRSTDMTR
jgi:hypothetical protein